MTRKATSTYTRELVESRLAYLRDRPEADETKREIEYLEQLKARKGWQ
jgi:hypothetical protein